MTGICTACLGSKIVEGGHVRYDPDNAAWPYRCDLCDANSSTPCGHAEACPHCVVDVVKMPTGRPTFMVMSVAMMDEEGNMIGHLAKAHQIAVRPDFTFEGTTIHVDTQIVGEKNRVLAVFNIPL